VRYTHLFFDLDRTLWDYDANSSRSLGMVYDEYNLSAFFDSAEEFIGIYNFHNDNLWEEYRQGKIIKADLRSKRFSLALMEKQLDDPELSVQIGERYMEVTPRQNILAPGTIETLAYLRKLGYHMYILTNGFLSTQELKLANSGIDTYFERIFSSEEIGINKPRQEIFHWAVSSLHAKKRESLMIGDDVMVDVRGAMDYGLHAVWFNPGKLRSEVTPTYMITKLDELKQIL